MHKRVVKMTADKIIAVFILMTISVFFIAGTISASDIRVQTGFQYDWWKDNKDSKAGQAQVPVKLEFSRKNYSLNLLTGYANTHVELADKGNESLSAMLDTKINFSYEIPKQLPVNVLLGLDLNLPTGTTDFSQEELILIMDPDLVSITTFGEGFNANPTIALAKQWGNLVAGAGAGYLWRGEYDFSETVRDYDPGDIVNTTVEFRYFFSPVWNGRVFGNYVWYGKDKTGSEDFYQEGDYYQLGLGLNYYRAKWYAGLTLRNIFRGKGSVQDAGGGLSTENNKSRGDELVGDLSLNYQLDDATALKSFFQGLYISRNDYSSEEPRFVGRREKYTVGVGASREFTKQLEGGVTLKGFVMSDAEANFPEPRSGRNYQGASFIVNLTSRFSGL